jgi:hypothetical protein
MSICLARRVAILVVGRAAIVAATPADADKAPVFVVPSRPGVPVMINGRNAAWAVVEGDWGLARPGHMPPTIIGGAPLPRGYAVSRRGSNSYYPRYGATPERGRHEIEPSANYPQPEPAETFTRVWTTQSEPQFSDTQGGPPPRHRAQSYNPGVDAIPSAINDPQLFNPPIVVVPQTRGRRP